MNENDDDIYGDEPAQRVGNGPETKPATSKLENVAALGRNPKTSRVIIATAGAVLVVGGIALVNIMSGNDPQPTPVPSTMAGAAVGAPPSTLTSDPNAALANSQQYQDIVAAASRERSQAALASGNSAQPLAVTVESALKPAMTPAEIAAKAAADEQLRQQNEAAERARASFAPASQPQSQPQHVYANNYAQQQQPDPLHQQMLTAAQAAVTQLIASPQRGTAVFSLAEASPGGRLQPVAMQQGGNAVEQQAGGQAVRDATANPSSSNAPSQFTLIGAGEILSARIDTGVNTDLGGDFGATLLTGKYAGAKLVGTVQRKGEAAVMALRMMSLPAQGVSLPAAGVILDAETAEGGTATDVDRKLLVKYGVKPVAAGFAAVAEYLKNAGTTVVVSGETVATSQPELTNKRAAQIIAGSAAQQVNSDANALDTTPTVRVKRGAIVGVFFTQDVVYTPKK